MTCSNALILRHLHPDLKSLEVYSGASIGAHLVNGQLTEGYTVHYWRHRNDEVDFVLDKKGKVIALEVKRGATQKAPGMQAFKKQYRPNKILLVGRSGLAWQEFLKISPADLF